MRRRWRVPRVSRAEVELSAILTLVGVHHRPQYVIEGMHKPWDFAFPDAGLIVELDGCWFHGCLQCHPGGGVKGRARKRNRDGHTAKDWLQAGRARKLGWTVLRFWEHEYMTDGFCSVIAAILAHYQQRKLPISGGVP